MPVEAKEFLRQYRNLLAEIDNMEAEVEKLRNEAATIRMRNDDERVQSSLIGDKTGEYATKIADMTIEIMGVRSEAIEKMREVSRVISLVENPNYKELLHMRYVRCLTFEKIAVKTERSYRHVIRLHGGALLEIKKILEKM